MSDLGLALALTEKAKKTGGFRCPIYYHSLSCIVYVTSHSTSVMSVITQPWMEVFLFSSCKLISSSRRVLTQRLGPRVSQGAAPPFSPFLVYSISPPFSFPRAVAVGVSLDECSGILSWPRTSRACGDLTDRSWLFMSEPAVRSPFLTGPTGSLLFRFLLCHSLGLTHHGCNAQRRGTRHCHHLGALLPSPMRPISQS